MSLIDLNNIERLTSSFYSKIKNEFAPKSHGTHLTLGVSSSTAFRGDYGDTAYTHSQAPHAPSDAQKNSDITKSEIEAKLKGAITSHTHSYLPLSGGALTGSIQNNLNTGTWLAGNQGVALLNSTNAAGKFTTLIKSNSTNGYFGLSNYQNAFYLTYTAKTTVDAEDNSTTKSAVLLNELGNTILPGSVTAPGGFYGNLAGNASTATRLSTAQTVALTGDVTGSASSQAGWSIETTLKNSGVTAGSYGPSANASPAHSGTFSVPYITVDAKGRITSASTKTITLPSDNNTDTKVTYTLGTTTKYYMGGPTATATGTGGITFDTGIYATTTAGQLSVGSLQTRGSITTSGNGSHDIGSASNRFKGVTAANVYSYGANATHYASLRLVTEGTADAADGTAGTKGVGRLVAGNNTNSGTAGNAKGQILLYGTNTGYTIIDPGNNSTSNITLTLPSSGGTLARTADALLLNGNNTMTGNIKMNNNTKITTKTANAINDTSGTAVAAGTEIAILEYNGSDNFHVGRDIYEKKLTSGATYISGGSGMTIRTNAGSLNFKPSDVSVLSVDSDSVDMAKEVYAKAGLKTGGNVYSDTAVTDNLGTGALPWKATYSKQFTVAGEASKTYGYLTTQTVGTADTVGVCRLTLGNNTASGTASNAKGQIMMYGSNTGYTSLTPGNNSTSNVTVTLPSATGSLPIMSKGDTSYWGMLAPDGGTSWIRTTPSGLIPSDQNKTSALGTATWPFGNIYGTAIYEDGTALSSKYAPYSHTHSYLPLSGGTLSGRLTANGKISVPTSGSSWITGMTLTNASIGVSTQQTDGSYHPILAVKTSGGHVANLGGIGNNVGFYGFYNGRTANGTDWQFTFNTNNGTLYQQKDFTVGSTTYLEGGAVLNNNKSLYGKNTSGTFLNICGVDSSNNVYLGWGGETYTHHHNTSIFKRPIIMNTGLSNSCVLDMYSNPDRLEIFWGDSNGENWNWNNKYYFDVNGQFYAPKQVSIGGHRITPYSGAGVSIINPNGTEFSGLEVRELWLGPYTGATYKFTVSPSAPASPSWGTVWVQI